MTAKQACPFAAYNSAIQDAQDEYQVGDADIRVLTEMGEEIARCATRLASMANGMSDGRRNVHPYAAFKGLRPFTGESLAQSMCECEFDWIAGFSVIVASAKLALMEGRRLDEAAKNADTDNIEAALAARGLEAK